MEYLIIDGAQGEGGGQVLRSALTLSMLTQTPIEIKNIRANRQKPGLMRQHLTSVMAAQQICDATLDGAELGSTGIRFAPNQVKAGNYHFAIGSAGSTVLVCQTILLALGMADGPSKVSFEGGTHNGMSPSLCFFTEAFLPLLKRAGIACKVEVTSLGFYPAGGGKWQIHIEPTSQVNKLDLFDGETLHCDIEANSALKAIVSGLQSKIGEREILAARKSLSWGTAKAMVEQVKTPGPGNSFQIHVNAKTHTNVFEVTGEVGVSAENIGKRCAGRVKKWQQSGAIVEEHLADQLLLLMAAAGGGRFTTTAPSAHTLTNIDVIRHITGLSITVQPQSDTLWIVSLE